MLIAREAEVDKARGVRGGEAGSSRGLSGPRLVSAMWQQPKLKLGRNQGASCKADNKSSSK